MTIETSASIENLAAALGKFEAKFVPEPNTGCWLWDASTNYFGYGEFMHKRKLQKAHRMAWRLYVGTIPLGKNVLHKCDVRNCVNPEHLFLGTQADNVADCAAKGRARTGDKRGERNNRAKANNQMARSIRAFCKSGKSQAEASRQFGMSPMAISQIVTRKAWAHVSD